MKEELPRELTQKDMASRGGKARAKALTKKQRSEIARKAIETRWARHREQQKKEKKS